MPYTAKRGSEVRSYCACMCLPSQLRDRQSTHCAVSCTRTRPLHCDCPHTVHCTESPSIWSYIHCSDLQLASAYHAHSHDHHACSVTAIRARGAHAIDTDDHGLLSAIRGWPSMSDLPPLPSQGGCVASTAWPNVLFVRTISPRVVTHDREFDGRGPPENVLEVVSEHVNRAAPV